MSTEKTDREPPHDPAARRNLIIVITLLVVVAVVLLVFGSITVMESMNGRLHATPSSPAAASRTVDSLCAL
ncbi:hypothetical protein [Leifsonia sp. AG29]|uniref:hypothetical protein n=1 Tax=Leifsonia sp. AG29 TaxID=2598860 RepID=UPI00131E05C3|nr:hypothetical protein [Leifsonia sp. AG29]